MALTPGPGTSALEIAIKMALKRKKEEEDKKAEGKKAPVTEKDMLNKGSQVYGSIKQAEGIEPKIAIARSQQNAYEETGSVDDMINEGLLTRDKKSGDLFPTAKYQEWKSAGKLKGKYNIK